MISMGSAVDQAIATHERLYPGSEVYQVEVSAISAYDNRWRVELNAAHFSARLVYVVDQVGQ